jgi:N-terminal domain of oxidoreductase
MAASVNRQILLKSRPEGAPSLGNFELAKIPVPEPGDGEVLMRTRYLSLDPYMRGRMSAAKSYAKPVGVGELMVGGTVGEIVKSRNPKFAVGDIVMGYGGWQDYALSNGTGLRKLDPRVTLRKSGNSGKVGNSGPPDAAITMRSSCCSREINPVRVASSLGWRRLAGRAGYMDQTATIPTEETAVRLPRTLIPFDKREAVSLPITAEIASKSERTVRNWCVEFGLGRRIGGHWAVSRVALQMHLDGNKDALAAYHDGARGHCELVAKYYRRLGLGDLLRRPECGGSEEEPPQFPQHSGKSAGSATVR